MLKIAIVTDSASNVPAEVAHELGIRVVPLYIIFGDESYLDGVDLDAPSFYAKLKTSSVIPSTSQPTPAAFMEIYNELLKEHDYIFSIHASSELSGTYQSAMLARAGLDQARVEVIDSRLATVCQAFVVIEAARAVVRGASVDKVRQRITEVMASVRLLFVVDTLEYLQKNGRIGKAASLVGSLLSLKPILTLEDGVVAAREKALGSRKAFSRVVQLMQDEIGSAPVSIMAVHSGAPDKAEELVQEAQAHFNCVEIGVTDVGPVIGAHTGPGAAGIAWHTVPARA